MILWFIDSLFCFGICKCRTLLIFLLLFHQKLWISLTLLQSACHKYKSQVSLCLLSLCLLLCRYNMLFHSCLNILSDIYKELTILIQFFNEDYNVKGLCSAFWSPAPGCVVFLSLGHPLQVFFWSYCVHGFVNLLWTWLSFLSTYPCLSLYCHALMRKQNYPGGKCTNTGSPVLIPGIQCPRILLPHLSSPSDLDQDPRSLLKFCTNRIIYKNIFSVECI